MVFTQIYISASFQTLNTSGIYQRLLLILKPDLNAKNVFSVNFA